GRSSLRLAGSRLAALAAGSLLLRRRAALRARAPRRARSRLLAAATRSAGGVRDLCRALLRHPLVLQRLVLLLVLDACALSRHMSTPFRRYGEIVPAAPTLYSRLTPVESAADGSDRSGVPLRLRVPRGRGEGGHEGLVGPA